MAMRVFLKSYGCSANLADSEVLTGCLLKAGYEQVTSVKGADIVIYNTCAVKGPTEDRVISALKKIPKNKKIIITGCLPLINFDRLLKEVHFDGAIGPAVGENIVDIVQRVVSGEKVLELETSLDSKPDLSLPSKKSNPIISIIPVNYGCLGSCAYCCVVFARGNLRSYPINDIENRVKNDLSKGIKEFWITSQDIGCYGEDLGTNIVDLLQTLCKIKGNFHLRVGMINPNRAKPLLKNLVTVFQNSKIFKFLHLPIQSGDDQILKKMRRFYTAQQFKHIIKAFRASIPNITIATDIICGFPGESLKAFDKTLQLIKDAKPDIVNVSKFFARPKTYAKKMKEDLVDLKEINRRSKKTSFLAKKISLERNKLWKNWIGEVFIDEVGKIPTSWIGRNYAYKPITVKSSKSLLGKTKKVKIEKAFPTYLSAKIL
ncbi:MAG: tRNA (N(6)-L-threonylcarbamoyladenosine(37)-C(2))-methylthiotransferase [Candidatus Bathyarchaeota archaeon]|nr:tRNA (N(6)-L-threonylcarbamoyladenosine(37)-C(2))-methylthiotransferase [Candidatus Bathyarchaeota archaeon]